MGVVLIYSEVLKRNGMRGLQNGISGITNTEISWKFSGILLPSKDTKKL